MSDLKHGVLFTSSKRAFTLRYLKFMDDLAFRAFASSKAVDWAYKESFQPESDKDKKCGKSVLSHNHEEHNNALMYYRTMKEFEPMSKHMDMQIGFETTERNVTAYDKYLHETVYPITSTKVTVLVGDGHPKVKTKCDGRVAHRGRPRTTAKKTAKKKTKGKKSKKVSMKRKCSKNKKVKTKGKKSKKVSMKRKSSKNKKVKHFNNGWFMVLAPSGRVVAVHQLRNPENNDDVELAFEKGLAFHQDVDCLVYDRNCSFAPKKALNPKFQKIKFWPIDKFHGERHSTKCKYSPKNKAAYKKRLQKVNTSVCVSKLSLGFEIMHAPLTRCDHRGSASWCCTTSSATMP